MMKKVACNKCGAVVRVLKETPLVKGGGGLPKVVVAWTLTIKCPNCGLRTQKEPQQPSGDGSSH